MANADFWQTLKAEFQRLAEYEHRVVPDPADSRRLYAYGDYTDANSAGIGRWRVGDGVSADFRTSFEEVATRAGSALNIPRGVESLSFWLHSVTTFLAVHESPYENTGYLAVWDPHRVGILRDAAAASAVYCSHLAKECTNDQVAGRSRGDGLVPDRQAGGKVSRRATCDLEVEDVRGRIKQMLAEGASHQEVCRRLANAPRPARVAWKHLPWDKAYMERRFRSSVCKWLSKNCRP